MRISIHVAIGSLLLAVSMSASADTFVPYTDGRAGGCMTNGTILYACTAQAQPSSNRESSEGYQAQNQDDYCQQERQRLNNANSDRNRTMTSMRAAEERFDRSGC